MEIAKWLHQANQEIKSTGAEEVINPFELAWAKAKESRDKNKSCSSDVVAAAEHFLYVRSYVETEWSGMKFFGRTRMFWQALGYQGFKTFGTKGNQTAPSDLQLHFGQQGAIDAN